MIEYKGYTGVFEYDHEAEIFHGEVIDLRDVITFQGQSVDELKQALKDSVDDYLEFCEELGRSPEKPFSGKFVVRLNPSLHREVSVQARKESKSLNQWVESTLHEKVNKEKSKEFA